MFKLSEKSKERRSGVDQRLIEISDLAIEITIIDFGIPRDGGVRIAERQKELYDAGKSKADGYKKLSEHQSKRALDFYAYVNGRASWEPRHLSMVACAMLQAASLLGYKLQWGGLWRGFKDMPHIQIKD